MNLQGQTAIVTGGSRGIGRAIAIKLASEGANVVIAYAGNETAANETKSLCEAQGVQVLAVKANVSVMAECENLFKETMDAFGRVDILVNNAGITNDKLMLAMSEEDFTKVIDTNLTGTFLCMKCATKIMMKQRYGRIINMSSIVGLHGNAGQVNYAASKAGVLGMTMSMAKELASRNITCNAIAPGMIETDMTNVLSDSVKEAMLASIPAKHAGKPEDVANAVAFFASPDSAYVTGQVLSVDGGMAV